jgi:signal transduction histidine kinase
MGSRRGNWATLWGRLAADSRFDLVGMRQAWLRRQVRARMRVLGLESYEAYLRLLQERPDEFAALAAALRSHIHRARRPTLRRQRAPARQWVDALPVAALLAEATGPAGGLRLLSCNRLACELLAAPEAALQAAGPRHQWLFPDLIPCADEDLPLRQALGQGGAVYGRVLLLRDEAGRLRPFLVSARPLPGPRPARAIATLQPATWEAEEGAGTLLAQYNEAQALADRYRRLFASSPAPLLVSRADGVIEEANAAAVALLGASEQLANTALAEHLAGDAQPALQKALQTVLAGGEARVDLHPKHRPGRLLGAHIRCLATGDGNAGAGSLVQWTLHDVTDHAEIERQRSDLTDMVLHDLRGPLATTLLGVETAGRALEHGEPPRAQRALTMAQTALRRLGRLVDSLLDISRLEAGHTMLQTARVEVGELLSEVVQEAELIVASNSLHLALEMPANLPAIVADRDMVYRALFNLLENAVKFSPPAGVIQLRAAAEAGSVSIVVADQGPGIPPDLQPHIFDKFVGLHLPHAPRGYGLGLAFCKLAIEAHGGRVSVESEPGRGSTFTLWLPAAGGIVSGPLIV